MVLSDYDHSGNSLIPKVLYSSSSSKTLHELNNPMNTNGRVFHRSPPLVYPSNGGGIVIPAPKEKVEMYSPTFYAACTVSGMLSTGITHTAVTPFDVLKCNMQVEFCFIPVNIKFSFVGFASF